LRDPKTNELKIKRYYSLDVEAGHGNDLNKANYLIISGDYGGSARVQVVYNSCINQLELYDPGYRYSLI